MDIKIQDKLQPARPFKLGPTPRKATGWYFFLKFLGWCLLIGGPLIAIIAFAHSPLAALIWTVSAISSGTFIIVISIIAESIIDIRDDLKILIGDLRSVLLKLPE